MDISHFQNRGLIGAYHPQEEKKNRKDLGGLPRLANAEEMLCLGLPSKRNSRLNHGLSHQYTYIYIYTIIYSI